MDTPLTVQQAQERILSEFSARAPEQIPLSAALHRVIASEILATQDLPPFGNSSMDGYAVQAADLQFATPQNPVSLPVGMQIPAGSQPARPLHNGETARIMTGAPLPAGADAVVPLEEVRLESTAGREIASFLKPCPIGYSVRARGSDLLAGERIFSPGKVLTPQDLGLLASFGYAQIGVFPRPRIALFSSGDELVQPGLPLGPGQIYDSNAVVLSGLLAEAGALCIPLGVARDDPADIERCLDSALRHSVDLIITSGGVSVGAFDFVRTVIEKNGNLNFWRVNMRPGKPLAFGSYKGIPLLGLPGNPVSAYVGCVVFATPILRKLSGLPPLGRRLIPVVLSQPIESDGRETYHRVALREENGRWIADFPTHQGSGNLASLVKGNALLILPIGVKSLPAGAQAFAWKPGSTMYSDFE